MSTAAFVFSVWHIPAINEISQILRHLSRKLIFRNVSKNTEHYRRSFYRAANAIFGRIGRIATEVVVLYLLLTKCVPILLYGLEACSIRKTDLDSLDFVVNRFFMKLFHILTMTPSKNVRCFFLF